MVTGGPSNDRANLLRLAKARRNNRLADEAELLAAENVRRIEASDVVLAEEAKRATGNTPLDNPSIWSKMGSGFGKVFDKISWLDEVPAGMVTSMFDKDQRQRRRELMEETPETGLMDYFNATRKSYQEKDLPLWASLPLEIAVSPLTWIPGAGIAKSALTGTKTTSKVLKGKEAYKKVSASIDFNDISTGAEEAVKRLTTNTVESDRVRSGPFSWVVGKLKGEMANINPDNPAEQILAKFVVADSKINQASSANGAKMLDMKSWKDFFDLDIKNIKAKDGTFGTIQGTGTKLDGQVIGKALEDIFDVGKSTVRHKKTRAGKFRSLIASDDFVDYDDLAKWVAGKAKIETDGWLDLLSSSTGLAAVKKHLLNKKFFTKGSTGNISDQHLQALAKLLYGYEEIGKQAKRMGVAFKTIAGGAFVARRVLTKQFDNVILNATASKGGKIGSVKKSLEKRRYKTGLEEEMGKAVTSNKVDYITDQSKVYELYSKDMYKAMNEEKLRKNLDVLIQTEGSSVVHGLDRIDVVENILTAKGGVVLKGKTGVQIIKTSKQKEKKLRDLGYDGIADVFSGRKADKEKALELLERMKKTTDAARGKMDIHGSEFDPVGWAKKSGQLSPKFRQYFFTGNTEKAAEALANRYRKLTGLANDMKFQDVTRGFGRAGDVLRIGKTGFDFGFMLLQGLPTLARAMFDPRQYAVWGRSVKEGAKAFMNKESIDVFMKEMRDTVVTKADGTEIGLLDEYVTMGGELGEYATDVYKGTSDFTKGVEIITGARLEGLAPGSKTLQRISKPGKLASSGIAKGLAAFERQFQFSSDVLRLKGYEIMRGTYAAAGTAEEQAANLRSLTQFLNKSTGALSPAAAGIPVNQQDVERAFIFFSPRYTRACTSLMMDTFRRTKNAKLAGNNVQAELAQKTLASMLGFGVITYVAMANALNQEPDLDPRSAKFLTVEIDGSRVGLGSFWVSTTRAFVKTADWAAGVTGIKDTDILDEGKHNPILARARSVLNPASSTITDLAMGQDFIGRKFDGFGDYAKHIGYAGLPLWFEGSFLEDDYRSWGERGSAIAPEMMGLRVRPTNLWEKRMNERDSLAAENYGKKWEDLNGLQKEQLVSESRDLQSLDNDIIAKIGERGTSVGQKLEIYYSERNRIKKRFADTIRKGLAELGEDYFYPRELREITMKKANAEKRSAMQSLYDRISDPEDLGEIQEYWDALSAKYGKDNELEDIAFDEYITEVVGGDWEDARGYNWVGRKEAEELFKQKWGSDYAKYVQDRMRVGSDFPPIVQEFYDAREKYGFYFEETEKAAINNSPFPDQARQVWEQYLTATESERILELENPDDPATKPLRDLKSSIAGIKKALRQQNQAVDAFTYRWGYTSKLRHRNNQGEELFWNIPQVLSLEKYETGPLDLFSL